MNDTVALFLDRARFYIHDAALSLTQLICAPDATLKISGRSYRLVRLLGEGGFAFVYLVQDLASGREFALKKILVGGGGEGKMKEVMKEVEAYRRFRHPNIIRILDCAVVQDEEGGGKIVYLFLPYYKRGNLQDVISQQGVTGERMPERELLRLFKGTCLAVRAMHRYRLPSTHVNGQGLSTLDDEDALSSGLDAMEGSLPGGGSSYPPQPRSGAGASSTTLDSAVKPLMEAMRDGEDGDGEVIFDGDEEVQAARSKGKGKGKGKGKATDEADGEEGEIVPYAHRDIKPGNIMIADDGSPILMDFGSAMKARKSVETRQQALLEQDIAAEHSTMPYRAPELFDVKTGTTLDEKVDIWSLGCTLFALAHGYSPFEDPAAGGGSIAMAVGSGRYRHPAKSPYSKAFSLLIDSMLIMDPAKRPDIEKVVELTDGVLATLR